MISINAEHLINSKSSIRNYGWTLIKLNIAYNISHTFIFCSVINVRGKTQMLKRPLKCPK